MAIEKSPYEGKWDDLNGRTALGKVVQVDVPNRRCHVKTIGLKGKTDDQDLPDVQWISASLGDDGQEDTSIPRVGSTGVLVYINHEPYLIGYFRPLPPADADKDPNAVEDPEEGLLNAGDKVLRSIGGNRIILRSGGTVEIESNKLCRTYWIPSANLISTVCGNHELETDGGHDFWDRDQGTDDTVRERLAWDNLEPSSAVRIQEGATDAGGIYRRTSGPLDDNQEISEPTYDQQIDALGSMLEKVALSVFKQIGPNGNAYASGIDINNKQASFSTPSGHTVVFDDSDADGSISIIHKTGASIQITGKGDIILQTGSGHTVSFANAAVGLTSKDGGTVSVSDKVVISDSSGGQIITLDGNSVNITASKTVIVSAPSVLVQGGSIDLGNNPSFHGVLYENLKAVFDAHIHPTAVGPSGPALPPNTMALVELVPTTSVKASFVKVRGNLTP